MNLSNLPELMATAQALQAKANKLKGVTHPTLEDLELAKEVIQQLEEVHLAMQGNGMLKFISYPMGGQIKNVKRLASEWEVKLGSKREKPLEGEQAEPLGGDIATGDMPDSTN